MSSFFLAGWRDKQYFLAGLRDEQFLGVIVGFAILAGWRDKRFFFGGMAGYRTLPREPP